MLFNPEINSIEEDILYHETQIKEAQERLDQVKVSQAFSDTVISSLEDFFENTDPFLYEVLKGHIDQMFEENKITYDNDLKAASLSSTVEEIKLPVASTTAPTNIESSAPVVALSQPQKEFGNLSYHELTGRPDVRPDTYENLAPNITYSSSGRAYVGFNDKQEAEKFRNSITEPSLLSDSETMNGYKYEVKFYCDRSYLEELKEELENDWTPEQKAELDWQEQLVRIAPDIFYDPSSSKCFVGFSNYQRANTYGAHLKEIHELYDSRYTVDKPKVVTNCKHELVIECITEENARKLSGLNLKKELEHKSNKAITDTWVLPLDKEETEEEPPSPPHAPQENATQEEQLDFPSPPYKPIPLDQVELCDVVTTSPNSQSAYEVREHKGGYIVTTCLYNVPLPNRIGEEFTFSDKVYLVEKGAFTTFAQNGDNSELLAS